MEPGLAFTLCGVGICFLIPAFILGFINRSKTTGCTVTTVATVKDILAKNSGDSLSFYPLYEYEVNNVLYTNTGAYLSHHVPQKGAKIEIRYNPDNPKKSYIPGYDTKVYKLLSIIFSVIGMIPVVCAACGAHPEGGACSRKIGFPPVEHGLLLRPWRGEHHQLF